MKRSNASLEAVLSYRNRNVLDRYVKDFGGTRKEATLVFQNTLKWLYLVNCAGRGPAKDSVECFITDDLIKIDEMWHTFILFTHDYTIFCDEHFGRYLHHWPTTRGEPRTSLMALREHYRRFYELVYETLGETTFRDWFFKGTFRRA